MSTPALVNIIPPKEPVIIENVRLSKRKFYDDLDITSYSYKCLEYLSVQFHEEDPGEWEKFERGILSKNYIDNSNWTQFENNNVHVTDSYIQQLSLFINDDFNLSKYNPDSAPIARKIDGNYEKLFSNGIKLCGKKKEGKVQVSFYNFFTSYGRISNLDAVLDLCSSVEAIYSVHSELRLMIALTTGALLDCTDSMKTMFKLYKVRNDFIHGNSIPEVTNKELDEYKKVIYRILKLILEKGDLSTITETKKSMINRIKFK